MARYINHFIVSTVPEKLHQALTESLAACRLDVVYSTNDYLMAREPVGGTPFERLVTVEVLINQSDRAKPTEGLIKLTFVTKNEELPLRADNHCLQMSDCISRSVTANDGWKVLEIIPG